MNDIKQRKLIALSELVGGYELYKGHYKNKLEELLKTNSITLEEYEALKTIQLDYANYIMNILARSPRVFIYLNKEPVQANYEDLDKLFEPLE